MLGQCVVGGMIFYYAEAVYRLIHMYNICMIYATGEAECMFVFEKDTEEYVRERKAGVCILLSSTACLPW